MKEKIVTFRVASFKHNQETSVTYRPLKTIKGLLKHIQWLAEKSEVDYVSLRMIRKEQIKLKW